MIHDRTGFFLSSQRPDQLWGPLNFLSNGTGIKQPGSQGNHSPPSSTEVKNVWRYASSTPWRGGAKISMTDNFTLI
jgi:hypothetical protein